MARLTSWRLETASNPAKGSDDKRMMLSWVRPYSDTSFIGFFLVMQRPGTPWIMRWVHILYAASWDVWR